MSKFLITTTPLLEGYSIKRYIGAVNTNIVLGTNFFSDFAASFTDVFGGTSDTYQAKMDLMYDKAKRKLIKKAQTLGGNAIVGFSTDFDEISGKGKSMFMLSASGTVCVVETPQRDDDTREIFNSVGDADYDREVLKRKLLSNLNGNGCLLFEDAWNFIIEHLDKEIIEALVKDQYPWEKQDGRQKIKSVVGTLDYEDAVDLVYPLFMSPYKKNRKFLYGSDVNNDDEIDVSEEYAQLIRDCKLFNASHINKLIDTDVNKALGILDCPKEQYTIEDIKEMRHICEKIDNLPDVGHVEMSKGGMFSKEKEIFVCQHGHKNDSNIEFCETCYENIKGISKWKIEKIDDFKKKVEILEQMLNKEH